MEEENKNEKVVKSMEVLRKVDGMLVKIEDKLDKDIDGMDSAIAALVGISVTGFMKSAMKIIERRLEKDKLFQ